MDAQEAFDATNPDPAAYGLPKDAPDADVRKARETAAGNLLAGVAANQAYWDSRTELEALRAQAEGHGTIGVPPDHPSQTSDPAAGAIEGSAVEEPAQVGTPPPTPENPVEAVAKLRAQLESAGINPEA